MDGVDVGRYARLRKVIADKGVQIPPRDEIGFDPENDRRRFHVSEGGVVVLPKGVEVPARRDRKRLQMPRRLHIKFGGFDAYPNFIWTRSTARSSTCSSATGRSPRRGSPRASA